MLHRDCAVASPARATVATTATIQNIDFMAQPPSVPADRTAPDAGVHRRSLCSPRRVAWGMPRGWAPARGQKGPVAVDVKDRASLCRSEWPPGRRLPRKIAHDLLGHVVQGTLERR